MDDILGILIPLLLFAGFYVFARLQKYLKEMNQPSGTQRGDASQIDAEERMRRRLEALAVKQTQAARKTGTVRQAAEQQKQQQRKPKSVTASAQNQTKWQSEEDMIEQLGIIEFERLEALGEIPAFMQKKQFSDVPTSTAVHRNLSAQLTGSASLRRMILAKEILDRPVSMRPPHNPFRK